MGRAMPRPHQTQPSREVRAKLPRQGVRSVGGSEARRPGQGIAAALGLGARPSHRHAGPCGSLVLGNLDCRGVTSRAFDQGHLEPPAEARERDEGDAGLSRALTPIASSSRGLTGWGSAARGSGCCSSPSGSSLWSTNRLVISTSARSLSAAERLSFALGKRSAELRKILDSTASNGLGEGSGPPFDALGRREKLERARRVADLAASSRRSARRAFAPCTAARPAPVKWTPLGVFSRGRSPAPDRRSPAPDSPARAGSVRQGPRSPRAWPLPSSASIGRSPATRRASGMASSRLPGAGAPAPPPTPPRAATPAPPPPAPQPSMSFASASHALPGSSGPNIARVRRTPALRATKSSTGGLGYRP